MKKKRKGNIIWFSPPYSESAKITIGRIFIKLIGKHFLPNHKFIKAFNKNIKPSYSCMSNTRSEINGHKKKILWPKPTEAQTLCSCLVKEDCPVNGLCLTSGTFCKGIIEWNGNKKKQKKIQRNLRNDLQDTLCNHKNCSTLSLKSKNGNSLSIEFWTFKQNH